MEEILTGTFWSEILANAKSWLINEGPGLIILMVLFFLAFKILGFSIRRLNKAMTHRAIKQEEDDSGEAVKRINTLTEITHSVIKIVLWIVLIMMVLQKLQINIAPILASAGIVGLAIGFGAQEMVRDFISGFFMLLENQIRTGDVVIINGTGGLVEEIALRTTTLRDFSGVVHVFPNGKISTISNMTKDWSAMVFDIGVAYKENTQQVIDIMKDVGDALKADPEFGEQIIEPIEVFGLDKFADSAIIIKARIKTKPIQQWTIGREYRKRLKEAFDQQNIEIPFPHTTVYWGDKTKPLQLDVTDQLLSQIKQSP